MPKQTLSQAQAKSKRKKWLINIIILILATAVMLAMAETAMRWIDGYQLSTLQLEKDYNSP